MANEKIILVEDDLSVSHVIITALRADGYEVESCKSIAERDALMASSRYDLLLTDIVMPEMDGIELAQRAAALVPDLRVMFITGFAAVTLKAGEAMPNARVLSKPFHLRDLVMEVDRLFHADSVDGAI